MSTDKAVAVMALKLIAAKSAKLADAYDEVARLRRALDDLGVTPAEARAGVERSKAKDAEIARLRSVCGEAYQMAGALGASVEAMDNLSAAANGYPLPHETFLPVTGSDEIASLRDEIAKPRAGADEHDSDCAMHNEPAYPNGPCDCSAAMQKGE